MSLLLLLALPAMGQQYAFPTSSADYGHWYPTAYKDQGGTTDWACSNITYSGHRGSDFGAGSFTGMDEGRDVVAAAPGVVVAVHDGEFDRCTSGDCSGGGGFGNHVYIAHGDGRQTAYAHLKQWSVLPAVGDEVACGDKLGEMGSSGYSTGPHLHFQVNDRDGGAVDPFDGACDPGPTHWGDQGVHGGLPTLDCDTGFPGCPDVDLLTCGDSRDARNDDAGSTSDHWYWGCTDFTYSGPELGWRFRTDLDEPVTVRLTGLTADLDLFLLGDDACDGRGCLMASTSSQTNDEEVVFDAVAGVEYRLVVDGWEGAVTPLHLEILCSGGLGTDPGTTTGGATGSATGVLDTGPLLDTGPGSNPEVLDGSKPLGCGCDHRGAGGWILAPLLLLAMRRRDD